MNILEAGPDDSVVFRVNRLINGDVLIRCFYVQSGGLLGKHALQVFYTTLSSLFVLPSGDVTGVHRLRKKDIDDAHDSKRFPETFFLDFMFARSPEPSSLASNTELTQSSGPTRPFMGWMIKQGGFIKNWKRRWFVLSNTTLKYFKNATNTSPLGVISLSNVSAEPVDAIDSPEHYYFKIQPRAGRTYYLAVQSDGERQEWVNEVNLRSHILTQSKEASMRQKDTDESVYSRVELLAAAELQEHLRLTQNFERLCHDAHTRPEIAIRTLVELVVEQYPVLLDALDGDGDRLLRLITGSDSSCI